MNKFSLFFLLSVFLFSPAKGSDFDLISRLVSQLLEDNHFSRERVEKKISEKSFDLYIEFLDPMKLYFLQEDIHSLGEKFRENIHTYIKNGEGTIPALEIYQVYRLRANQRIPFSLNLLKENQFRFGLDDSVILDRKDAKFAKTEEEAEELWGKRIKAGVLSEILQAKIVLKNAKARGKEDLLEGEVSSLSKVRTRYQRLLNSIQQNTEEDIVAFFLNSLSHSYDPHTGYLSKEGLKQFMFSMENSLIGIGALLRTEDDGTIRIEGIIKNGPADIQGELKLNDRILGVDSLNDGNMTDILFMEIGKVAKRIRGKEGTHVQLKVRPANGIPGEVKFVIIRRERVKLKDGLVSATFIMFQPEKSAEPYRLAWLKIPSFYADFERGKTRVSEDLERLILRLNQEKVDGIALDLRSNGGGSLLEVQKIVGMFVGKLPVVQVVNRYQSQDIKYSYKSKIYTKPIVLVTNVLSASASEILAGALQDYGRAVVIGDSHTFGKGTVQQPMRIASRMPFYADRSQAGLLKVTVQKFYRVSGKSTQVEGVIPDIILPSVLDAMEIGEKWAKNPLIYDEIGSVKQFDDFSQNLPLNFLRNRSQQRVSRSQDFLYFLEDKIESEKELKKNSLSLNYKKRWNKILNSENKRLARRGEMLERFGKIKKEDESMFQYYRLNLEDLDKKNLKLLPSIEDKSAHMHRSEDKIKNLTRLPKWPSLMDPVQRESLSVLVDLIVWERKGEN